jgi:nucleotide-binding universal stress UspA family protein
VSIRRILVGLDVSGHSLAALEAAAEMAARLEAELVGLFVEDINLVRLASFPFAREVGFPSATRRELDTSAMERMLHAAAAEARRTLAAVAERTQVPWSFRVARGAVVAELLAAAVEADLIALGLAGRQIHRRGRLGSTALDVMVKAPGTVLLLQEGVCLRSPVMIVCEAAPISSQALTAAANLARACADEVIVLLLGETREATRELEEEARQLLPPEGRKLAYRTLTGAILPKLAQAARDEKAGALILLGDSPLLGAEEFQELLADLNCPVLVVR